VAILVKHAFPYILQFIQLAIRCPEQGFAGHAITWIKRSAYLHGKEEVFAIAG